MADPICQPSTPYSSRIENSHKITYFCQIAGRLTLSQTSPGFLCVCSTRLLKTVWEKEKLLVMSNFSFPTVFSTYLEKFLLF